MKTAVSNGADIGGSEMSPCGRTSSEATLIGERRSHPLSVCFFAHSAYANGAERSLASLVKDLVSQYGTTCTVFLPETGPLEELIRDAGASCVVVPYAWWCYFPRDGKTDASLQDDLSAGFTSYATKLLPLVREIDPDVICTQTLVIPWGAAVATALGKPHIWSVCEYGELDHGLRFVPSFQAIAADIEQGSDFVFFAAKDIKTTLFGNLAEQRSDVLYRHIQVEPPRGLPDVSVPSAQSPKLIVVGTLAPTKGQADAIAALALLKKRGVAAELTMVGSGYADYAAELRRRVAELDLTNGVHFVDFLTDPFQLMSRADIALVCSRREAFGRVAVEAMLLGKPVVYAAAGGIAEYMRDGETGLGYPPGDISALADRIETLIRDAGLRMRMGTAAQSYARATFSRDEFAGKFYRKALELRGAPSVARFPATLLRSIERALGAVETLKMDRDSLETELGKAQHDVVTLKASLGARAALLAEAESTITAPGTAIDERVALLSEMQVRAAAAEVVAAAAKDEVAQLRRNLDERTAELAHARAATESMAQRDRDLTLLRQRIATIKKSLSWRLMTPFREMYRPIRWMRRSHLGIKLRAAWRHPSNSRNRKAYRARHGFPTPPDARNESTVASPRVVRKFQALLRHPFSSRSRKLYRAGEKAWPALFQPSNGDGTEGKPVPEGVAHSAPLDWPREPHPGGFRAEALATLRPFNDIIAEWRERPRTFRRLSRDSLLETLHATVAPGTSCVLSFSHDNYRTSVGGIQLCVLLEEEAFARAEASYIHLSPLQPLPVLASLGSVSDYRFSISLNGKFLGHVLASDLSHAITAQKEKGVSHRLVIHSLLGHSPELVVELCKAAGLNEGIYWLHDYFSLCPSYTLMRNAITYCGAPPPASVGCHICYTGDHRVAHLERMRSLFSAIAFTVVAPSPTALSTWQKSADFPIKATVVQGHCKIRRAGVSRCNRSELSIPLRVAFLGFASLHKGWPLFCEVAELCESDQHFAFHHFGRNKSKVTTRGVTFHRVDATTKDRRAMSNALASNKIDVAFLCSLWPETYNFTAVEALAGGALVVTLSSSGNVAALVKEHQCGVVFNDEAALKNAFITGSLVKELRALRRKNLEGYTYAFGRMSADVRLSSDPTR